MDVSWIWDQYGTIDENLSAKEVQMIRAIFYLLGIIDGAKQASGKDAL